VEENVELKPGRIMWRCLTLKDAENIKDFIARCRLVRFIISHRRIQWFLY